MKTVTNIGVGLTTAQSNANWSQPAQQTTILNGSSVNPKFLRNVVLETNGVKVVRNNLAVGINIADIVEAAVTVEPTLTSPPNITTQPLNQFVNAGTNVHISIVAAGEFTAAVPITFQWQISTDNGSTWNTANTAYSPLITNFTTNNVALTPSANLGAMWRCVAISNAGNTNSNSANLATVAGPMNASVAHPTPVAFAVLITGPGTFAYEWQLSTDGGGNYANLADNTIYSNSATNALNISNTTGLTGYKFRCLTNNGSAQIISNVATLTVT